MAKQYDLLLRVLLVGDSGVGKTCLLCKYTDEGFSPHQAATIGIDFKVKHVNYRGQRVRMQIWDTAGQERFETITKQYYRRAQGVLLVYDITNESSFRHILKWMAYVRQYAGEDIEMTLIGNKTDLGNFRQVPREEGLRFAQQNRMAFFETSAFTDNQINLIYEDLVQRIMQSQADDLAMQRISSLPSDTDSDYGGSSLNLNKSGRSPRNCCSN